MEAHWPFITRFLRFCLTENTSLEPSTLKTCLQIFNADSSYLITTQPPLLVLFRHFSTYSIYLIAEATEPFYPDLRSNHTSYLMWHATAEATSGCLDAGRRIDVLRSTQMKETWRMVEGTGTGIERYDAMTSYSHLAHRP